MNFDYQMLGGLLLIFIHTSVLIYYFVRQYLHVLVNY